MNGELITIIIPLYNKEKYIKETIENIKKQTYSNWELIIIDDGSTDNSYSIASAYKNEKIKVVKNQKNEGVAKTRNQGINLAKGRYICFQDADDLWDLQKLEKQICFMKENNCAFSYTGFRYIRKNGRMKKNSVKVVEKLTYKEALKNTRILTISTMFDMKKIDKELLKMPNIMSEDIATWWNILKEGYIAFGINECLVYYRQVANSLCSNKIKSAYGRWILYRRHEKLSLTKTMYYFFFYVYFAIIKRIG